MCVKLLQSCLTLWDPMDCSRSDSSVHGILQAGYWSGLPFPSPGIFPAQESNPGLLHCGQILYRLQYLVYIGCYSVLTNLVLRIPVRKRYCYAPYLIDDDFGTERLSNLLKVTQLWEGKTWLCVVYCFAEMTSWPDGHGLLVNTRIQKMKEVVNGWSN